MRPILIGTLPLPFLIRRSIKYGNNQILGFVIIVLSALNIRRMLRAREGEQNKGYLFLNSKAIIVNALLG